MGRTLTPVPFTDTALAISPHTATLARDIKPSLSLEKFARGELVSVYVRDDGEYMFRATGGRFALGPRVSS